MKKIYILAVTIFMMFTINGQSFAQTARLIALGLRGTPDGRGFTGRFFIDRNFAIEVQLNGSSGNYYINNDGPSMTLVGLAEYFIILPDPSWRIFVGGGLHGGSWDRYNNDVYESYRTTQGIFGVDGTLGVEYIFKRIPVGISADVKPAINVAPQTEFYPDNIFGISGRVYFGNHMHRRPASRPMQPYSNER